MEGRHPPPRASHPFPDQPNLTKFWNTPYSKAFFKSLGSAIVVWGAVLTINLYVTRSQKGPFGLDWTPLTKEQLGKKKEMSLLSGEMRRKFDLPVDFAHEKGRFSSDIRMLFDDGVKFSPPKEIRSS